MKTFSDLTREQQDLLLKSYTQYAVQLDPKTYKEYIRFMGEDVDFRSISNAQILLG